MWSVEVEQEVEKWIDSLPVKEFATEEVREAREAAGVSQRELAARMSTSQAAVARLEAGGTSATLTTLRKAAAALGLELTIDLAPAH